MSESSGDHAGTPAERDRINRLQREVGQAERELSEDVRELVANPPPDVPRVVSLLDALVAPQFSPVATERLVQFVDADRPAAPAIFALSLHQRAGLAQTFFPHRFALGLVAHSSPPQVQLDDRDPPKLQFGCVPEHYQRVMRRVKAVREILGAIGDQPALTVMQLSDAQLARVLQARALTESLAYDDRLGADVVAVLIEELIAAVMTEVAMLQGFLDVATGPIQLEGRLRLATIVPETIDLALRTQPRPIPGSAEILRIGLPGAPPRFFADRWIDGVFANAARGVSAYMQSLATAA